MTKIVAASHNTDKTANLSTMQALGNNVAIGLTRAEFDIHCLMARLGLCDQIGQRQVGIRTCHQVGMVVL